MESIDTKSAGRDRHLKSPDFFNAVEYPTLAFKSTSVKAKDEKTLEVTGEMSLHGVTKSITVEMRLTGMGEGRRGLMSGFESTFTVKRSDYGMNHMLGGGLGDEVQLMLSLEGGAR